MKLIMLSKTTEFLGDIDQLAFLQIDKYPLKPLCYVAGKNWWVNVENDMEIAPGSYIFNRIDKKWRPETFQAQQMIVQIEDNIKDIYSIGYYKADFERVGRGDIVLFRKTTGYWEFDEDGLFYKLISGEQSEIVNAKVFDFLYTNLSVNEYLFLMNRSKNKPIVFIENPFGTDAFRPRALILPVSENKRSFVFDLDKMSFEKKVKIAV